jgi:hypothetical protein
MAVAMSKPSASPPAPTVAATSTGNVKELTHRPRQDRSLPDHDPSAALPCTQAIFFTIVTLAGKYERLDHPWP